MNTFGRGRNLEAGGQTVEQAVSSGKICAGTDRLGQVDLSSFIRPT
jgi:hypothetical protein